MAGDRKLTIKFLGEASGLRNTAGEVDSSLTRVRAAVDGADGVVGKFKAGAASLSETLKANVATAAIAAGTAIVAFGVKAVQAYQELALESGKFADATGVNVEEASRLAEVTGDLGIELSAVQGALQKFNKAAADGSVDVEGFGNTIVRAADGTVDAYQSFINAATAIGAIADPTRRAEAAQETFGRSYGEIAELMEMDAESLRQALAGVSDGKIITEEELANAKAFREGMDRVKDAIEEVTLAVGGAIAGNSALIDTFADSLETMAKYADEAMAIADAFLTVTNPLYAAHRLYGMIGDDIDLTTISLEELKAQLEDRGFSTEQIEQMATQWHAVNDGAKGAAGAVAGYNAEISTNAALEVTAAENRRRTADETRYTAQAIDELRRRLGPYSEELNAIPEDVYSEIRAALDMGDIARAEALLNEVTRSRIVQVGIAINSGALAGAAAGAAGPVGKTIGAGIAAAIAGAKMPSSVGGGGGGGSGGGPIEDPMLEYDRAIANLFQTEQTSLANYRQYLQGRLGAYETYSDEYRSIWSKLRELDKIEADAAKDVADAEKRKQDEAKKAAEEQTKLAEKQLDALQKLLDLLTGFASADAGNLAGPGGNIIGSGATGSLNAGQLGGLIADLLRFYQEGVS